MYLDPAEWAEFHLRATMLTDDQLTELTLYFQANSMTAIDKEHHRIIQIVIEERAAEREGKVKKLEKCLELSTPKGYLLQKIHRGFKRLHRFIHCSNPFKNLNNHPYEEDIEDLSYCI